MRFALTAARRTALASRQATKVAPPRMVVRGMAGSSVHGENPDVRFSFSVDRTHWIAGLARETLYMPRDDTDGTAYRQGEGT